MTSPLLEAIHDNVRDSMEEMYELHRIADALTTLGIMPDIANYLSSIAKTHYERATNIRGEYVKSLNDGINNSQQMINGVVEAFCSMATKTK